MRLRASPELQNEAQGEDTPAKAEAQNGQRKASRTNGANGEQFSRNKRLKSVTWRKALQTGQKQTQKYPADAKNDQQRADRSREANREPYRCDQRLEGYLGHHAQKTRQRQAPLAASSLFTD